MPSRRLTWLALAVLVLLAALTRLSGIDQLLPHRAEIDNGMAWQADMLARGEEWAPGTKELSKYPLLIPTLATLVPGPKPIGDERVSLESHLEAAVSPFVRVRLVVAFLGACAVPATFVLARMFFSPGWALVAAAWMLVNFLSMVFAAQARGHGAMGTLTLLAVLAAVRMRRRPDPGSYVLAGLAAAAAVASLHNGVAVLIPLGVAHITRTRGGRRSPWWYAAIPIVIVVAALLYFYGPLLRGIGEHGGLDFEQATLYQGGHRVDLSSFNGGGFRTILRSLWWYDPVLLVLATLQLGSLLPRARLAKIRSWLRGDHAVVLAFAVPYFLIVGAYEHTYARFLIPLAPYLCLLATGALRRLTELVPRPSASPVARAWTVALCVLACLAGPTYATFELFRLRTIPDTIEEAAQWIADHVDPRRETVLVSTGLILPLLYDPEGLPTVKNAGRIDAQMWRRYQAHLAPAQVFEMTFRITEIPWQLDGMVLQRDREAVDGFLARKDADFVVVQVDATRLDRMEGALFHSAVQAWGTLVARFPDEPASVGRLGLEYQDIPRMAWRVTREEILGPAIEVYRRGH